VSFATGCTMYLTVDRVPTPPGKSWKVLEFLLENFQNLESPGNLLAMS